MELLQTFKHGDIAVDLFYKGSEYLPFTVHLKGELIYEDDSFRPSPLYGIDNPQTMASLLGFLTVRRGDTDDDYFEARNCPKLLEWAENDEEVRSMLYDYEQRDDASFLAEFCEDEEWKTTAEYLHRLELYITSH
jgi:hypothetical protein